MRFSISAVLALAASAFAQTADFDPIYLPAPQQVLPAGSVFTITWDAPAKYAAGTISIELIGGATQGTQIPLSTIATGVKNAAKSYSWHVDASLGDKAVYGLVFKLESNPAIFQYSNPFHIKAGGIVTTSAKASTSAASYSVPSVPSTTSAASSTVTVTTSTGVKTVTLSTTSAPVTSTYVPETTLYLNATTTVPCNSTAAAPTSSVVIPQSSPSGSPSKVFVTSTAWSAPSNPPAPPAPSNSIPATAGSAKVGASTLALVGGLAMAFFAL